MKKPIDFSNRLVPSNIPTPPPKPQFGSIIELIDALPDGAYLFVPAVDVEATKPLLGNRPGRIRIRSDVGGIHGALADVPPGAVVGVGLNAFATLSEGGRENVKRLLEGRRFRRVLWA